MTTGGGFIAGSIIGKLLLDKSGWDSSVKAVTKDTEKAARDFEALGTRVQGFGKNLTIVGGAITAAFGAIVKKTADAGDAFWDLSQKTGISVETLSSFKLAADKSGTSIEGFAVGMRGLSRVMNDANTGLAEAKRAFDQIGVAYADSTGKLRPLNDVMLDVADRFKDMPDGAQKTALAMELFGRSGMDLIPMLNLGKAGLSEMTDRAKELGIVFSTEDAQACDAFNDSLADLKGAVGASFRAIALELMPAIKSLADKVATVVSSITAWAKEHPGLTKVISGTALGLGALMTAMGSFIFIAGTLITKLATIATALKVTMGALSASLAVWAAAAAAVGLLASKYIELGAAEDYEIQASRRLAETENQLVDKLSEAAVAADWQYGRMSKLIEAYHGNIAALAMAIKQGKEGADIQKALAEVGAKHNAVIEEQRKKLLGLGSQAGDTGRIFTDVMIPAIDEAHLKIQELGQSALLATPKVAGLEAVMDQIPGIIDNTDWQKIPENAEPAIAETRAFFDGLWSDIARGFGDTLKAWLSGATTFKDFMVGLWGDIKDAIFSAIGEEVTKKLMDLFSSVIKKTKDVGDAISKNIGGVLGGAGKTAGSMAGSFLSAASSIANIVTAVASVVNLLKSPPTGAGDGMGRVVERQDQQTALLTTIRDFLWNDQRLGIQWTGKIMDYLYGGKVTNWLSKIYDALKNMTSAAAGAVLTSPQVVMTHGTPAQPEYVIPAPDLQAFAARMAPAQAQSGRAINVSIEVKAIDRVGVETFLRRDARDILQRMLNNHELRPVADGIGG